MKNSVKLLALCFALFFLIDASAVMAQTSKKQDKEAKTVEAIYFHNTRRCGWCVNLEKSSREAIEELYADELKDGTVKLVSANLQQPEGVELAKRYNITSVAFVIALGDESTNLTQAGLAGQRDPESYKKAIKETVDGYLNQ